MVNAFGHHNAELGQLAEQLRDLQVRIGDLEKDLVRWSRDDPVVKCLQTIPGKG